MSWRWQARGTDVLIGGADGVVVLVNRSRKTGCSLEGLELQAGAVSNPWLILGRYDSTVKWLDCQSALVWHQLGQSSRMH